MPIHKRKRRIRLNFFGGRRSSLLPPRSKEKTEKETEHFQKSIEEFINVLNNAKKANEMTSAAQKENVARKKGKLTNWKKMYSNKYLANCDIEVQENSHNTSSLNVSNDIEWFLRQDFTSVAFHNRELRDRYVLKYLENEALQENIDKTKKKLKEYLVLQQKNDINKTIIANITDESVLSETPRHLIKTILDPKDERK